MNRCALDRCRASRWYPGAGRRAPVIPIAFDRCASTDPAGLGILGVDHALDDVARAHAARVDAKRPRLELWICQDRALLSFEHRHVLLKDASLLFFEPGGETDVVNVEIASHPPKIVAARVALRRYRVDDEAAHSLIMSLDRGTGGYRRHSDIDNHRGRRQKMADLPPIHPTFLLQGVTPEWRCLDIRHPARDRHPIAFGVGLDWRIENLVLTDGALVRVRFVRQIHQVIDDHPIVAFDVIVP